MVPVPVGRRPREYGDDDLRPEPPDHLDHVLENRVARPEAEGLIDRLRKAEIVGPREELARAVELTRGEQLLGTDDAELGAELGTDQILAALTARQRQIRRLRAHPARQQHQELGILVVGVRADHEHALVAAELPQRSRQRSDAAGAGWGQLSLRNTGGAEAQEEPEQPGESDSHYWERYTAPPFITNLTRCSSVMSRVGSPATATMSA